MLQHLRHVEISRTLERQGGVKVSELSGRLGVTEETIRRDLVQMEAEKLLVRTHGGAVPVETPQNAMPYHIREVENVEAKRSIARAVVSEIREDDAMFLDGSTTAYQLARVFPDIRCTVITHSEPIFQELCRRTNVELISTGGVYDRRSASFVGPLAEQMISTCHITKAFLGCKGLDVKRGFSDASVRHMNLKRSVMQWAGEVYILADFSKWEVCSRYFFAGIQDAGCVVTDRKTTKDSRRELEKAGVRVLVET
ncbi:MAG: DeoR/GlpR transcriptional regulator [Verrucomicrobia bacterium]|nr:DeoR/GlpR transcriptional regulator [Verrucomicrobiota bacterium]MCH8527756.1 DeoR/GlpR family DNA-binding transcription regulator [Kiritimatiellia bacterium]